MVEAEVKKTGKKGIITFSGTLTVNGAVEIKEALLNALSRFKILELTFGDVSDVDVAFLQLLCSAHRTSVRQKRTFSVIRPFPAVMDNLIIRSGFLRHKGCKGGDACECFWVPGGRTAS
jgi:anti-anti-sigma regulatory factor